jgi:hypothetical protein
MNKGRAPGATPEHRGEDRMFILKRDGEFVLRGTEFDIYKHIHRKHSFSVDWACAHEGYEIIPEGESDAENPQAE